MLDAWLYGRYNELDDCQKLSLKRCAIAKHWKLYWKLKYHFLKDHEKKLEEEKLRCLS